MDFKYGQLVKVIGTKVKGSFGYIHWNDSIGYLDLGADDPHDPVKSLRLTRNSPGSIYVKVPVKYLVEATKEEAWICEIMES